VATSARGFEFGGSSFDSNLVLQGSLKLDTDLLPL
jgi:hypothetical protein